MYEVEYDYHWNMPPKSRRELVCVDEGTWNDLCEQRNALIEACRWALDEWFDRVYPPDIFVGRPKSDPGVNEVREVANRLRDAIAKAEGRE